MKLKKLLSEKDRLLSVYFTAGFPNVGDTLPIMEHLEEAGADILEIGIPFSDPVADGPTIQGSNDKALSNGMTMKLLLDQIQNMRDSISIPVILMGYINPVLQYGMEDFCKRASEVGVDGLILPDLPVYEYEKFYKPLFRKYELSNIFLITPQTPTDRIQKIDENSDSFIYAVSSTSITGAKNELGEKQIEYLERINDMKLNNPFLVGFGISNNEMFEGVCKYGKGAIIGSAFINILEKSQDLKSDITEFIHSVKGKK